MEVDLSPRGFGFPQLNLSLNNLVETEVIVGDEVEDYLPTPISEEPFSEFSAACEIQFDKFATSAPADELPSWSEHFERSRVEPESPEDYPSLSESCEKPGDFCRVTLGEANGEEIVTAVKYYVTDSGESDKSVAKLSNELENVTLQSKLPRKEKHFLRRSDPRRRTISSVTGVEFQSTPVKVTPNRLQAELKVQAQSPLLRSSPRSSFNLRSSRTPQPSPGLVRSRLSETSPLPRPKSGYSSPGRSSASPLPSEGSRDSPLGTRPRPKQDRSDRSSDRKPFTTIIRPSPPHVEMASDVRSKQDLVKAAADKFATLPRRRPKPDSAKVSQPKAEVPKNAPVTKDPPKHATKAEVQKTTRRELIPNMMTSSSYSTLPRKSKTTEPPPTKVEVKKTLARSLRPSSTLKRPTLICHETETQTILYGFDLDAGATLCSKCSTPDEVKTFDTRSVQVDIGSRELEAQVKEVQKRAEELAARVRELTERLSAFDENDVTVERYVQLQEELQVKTKEWHEARSLAEQARVTIERERSERSAVQLELDRTSHRVAAMLDSMEGVEKEFANRGESLMHLEGHLQLSTQTICRLQTELDSAQSIISAQQRELDRSLAAQKMLLQQLQETEAEARELQEFLQAEKATMGDSLREAESLGSVLRSQISDRDRRIRELEDQANFIGKISEQRRQELSSIQQSQLMPRSPDGSVMHLQSAQSAISNLGSLAGRLEKMVNEFYAKNGIQEKSLRFEFDPSSVVSRPSSQSSDDSGGLHRNPPEGQESCESTYPSETSVSSTVQKIELMVEKLLKGVAFANGEMEAKKDAAILERDQLVLNLNAAHQSLRDSQEELIRRSQVESKLRRELQGAHALLSAKHSRANEDMKVIEKLTSETTVLREQLQLSGNFDDLNNPVSGCIGVQTTRLS